MLKDEELSNWLQGTKYQLDIGMLPLLFFEVPSMMMKVLGVTCLQAPTTKVADGDKNGHVLIRKRESFQGFITARDSFCQEIMKFF